MIPFGASEMESSSIGECVQPRAYSGEIQSASTEITFTIVIEWDLVAWLVVEQSI